MNYQHCPTSSATWNPSKNQTPKRQITTPENHSAAFDYPHRTSEPNQTRQIWCWWHMYVCPSAVPVVYVWRVRDFCFEPSNETKLKDLGDTAAIGSDATTTTSPVDGFRMDFCFCLVLADWEKLSVGNWKCPSLCNHRGNVVEEGIGWECRIGTVILRWWSVDFF